VTENSNILQIEELVIHFDTFEGVAQVLDGVSLDLARGQTLGVVGETGCGKSITSKAVLGLLPVPPARMVSGRIMFDGEDLLTKSGKEIEDIRGTRIAMIFQDPMTYLNPVFSIEKQMVDVIVRHGKTKREPVSRKEAREKAVELLEAVQIPGAAKRIREYPHEFSGGMRQRVLIAMALSGQPELLIADEPTTALDVTIQAQILSLLASIQKEFRMGLILITHDLGVVARTADRVAVMYCGQIVESGNVEDVFNDPLHPYTRGLMDCIPVPGTRSGQPLGSIPGIVPTPIGDLWGCAFRNRCSMARAGCDDKNLALTEISPGRACRCVMVGAKTDFSNREP